MGDRQLIGGINNFNGVMLCARPNELGKQPAEKIFCSRVEQHDALGLNPFRKEIEFSIEPKPKPNPALQRHKDWLEIYKLKMNLRKEEDEEKRAREDEKFEKVKEIAAKDRERSKIMREEYDKANEAIKNTLQNSPKRQPQARLTEKNLKIYEEQLENNAAPKNQQTEQKVAFLEDQQQQQQQQQQQEEAKTEKKQQPKESKKEKDLKPKWAYSEKELVAKEEEECDDLLDFVNTLDYDQYINDLEVQSMVKAIKSRIEEIKEKDTNSMIAIQDQKKQEKKNRRENQQADKNNDDVISQASSTLSEAKSVRSEKSIQSIQSLKEKINDVKKGKTEWEASSQLENAKATLEERLAKNVADEVLRNYKNLGGVHSNQSIRKLLEREAHNYINKGIVEGPLISVVKETTLRRNEIDPNNLPYLHRNPAI